MKNLRMNHWPLELHRVFNIVIFVCLFSGITPSLSAQKTWHPVGPVGGNARAFAPVPGKPNHLYLGTMTGSVYESTDEGTTWHRLSTVDPSNEMVLDRLAVDHADSQTLYAGAWRTGQQGGGFWISHDGAKTWKAVENFRGQEVLSFRQSSSDSSLLLVGTLNGVYRSEDKGVTWALMSPEGSKEIHEVGSIAIDPANSKVIYAGTWHLPWKTEDGGKSWHSIREGLIDDSDVFSIIIDPAKTQSVFLSACSGIYKSENGGELFHKIQGIPSSARRTRVMMQDPLNHNVVYAGTTEGLYKTIDGGQNFKRMTGPEVIVNDVYVDPTDSNRVLLATDRGGVLVSKDGASSFIASNEGFSGRKVEALLVDRSNPSILYAGVVNDRSYGGVFLSKDGGGSWLQMSNGLAGSDVYALAQAKDGTLLAGTGHGIYTLQIDKGSPTVGSWVPRNTISNTTMKPGTEVRKGKRVNIEKLVKLPVVTFDGRAFSFDVSGDVWVAATSAGILTSRDSGATWQGGPVMGLNNYKSITVYGNKIVAARQDGVVISSDAGKTWLPVPLSDKIQLIARAVFSADGTLWLGAKDGVYLTHDSGSTWERITKLPLTSVVDDINYDAEQDKILVSSRSGDQIFAIHPKELTWKWWFTGYKIRLIRAAGSRLVAASLYDGVLLEPQEGMPQVGQR